MGLTNDSNEDVIVTPGVVTVILVLIILTAIPSNSVRNSSSNRLGTGRKC